LADLTRPFTFRSFSDPTESSEPANGEWLHPFEIASGVPDRLVESARDDARATGYAVGWAQGMRAAYSRMADEAALVVTIEAPDMETREQMKGVMAKHLDRFAFREAPLLFGWN